MKLKVREQIKTLLSQEAKTQKDLVKILTDISGKKYTPTSFAQKLSRGTMTYNEVLLIAEILGYKIKFEKEEQHK